MRIPPSVIVMSLVTAVPFALAVRDTVKPHEKTLDEMTDGEREAHFEAQMQKEAEQDAQREAAKSAARDKVYQSFFGAKPAQLGSFFGTVQLGIAADDPAIEKLPRGDYETIPYIDYERTATLDAIRIPGDDHCDALNAAMIKAWGDSQDGVYLDPASRVRAKYGDCTVTFDRYVEVNAWVDKRDAAPVPLTLVGKSLDKLHELVPHIDQDDGGVVMWTEAGIGRGAGPTHLTATIENDKVTHVTINVMTDAPTADAVKARLVGLLGKGTANPDDPDVIEWKRKGAFTFASDTVSIELGKD